ncbi:MAG: cytochrome P450 [Actinomycetota bacterium]
MRAAGPARQVEIWGGQRVWLVTRYVEAKTLLADPRLVKDRRRITALFPPGGAGPMQMTVGGNMLFSDPPDHTRIRKLVAKAFTARSVARMHASIAAVADDLLDHIESSSSTGTVDMISNYAAPLPIRVISELLGVPNDVTDEFRELVMPLVTVTEPAALQRAQGELESLLSQVASSKRAEPTDDLLTMLVNVADDRGDQLSESELLATTFLLVFAGYETTVNLIGNGILALADYPAQFQLLRDDPTLVATAVEEFLRFEAPLNTATLRMTTVDIELDGVTIPADELVMISLLSAGRDERQFSAPDVLDVKRHPNPHLAFGHGVHHCLGAPLARLEGRIAFSKFLERFERVELDCDRPRYRNSLLMRGLEALPVLLHPAPPAEVASKQR